MEQQPTAYEFTEEQNLTIKILSKRMKFIGILNLIFAVLMAIGGLFALFKFPGQAIVAFAEVALFGFMGAWNYKAAGSFQLIVQTTGSDIAHLMEALTDLKKIYSLQYWLMIVVLVLVLAGIIVAVFLVGSMASEYQS